MSSNSSDGLKDFEKIRGRESMRAVMDRDDDFSDDELWEDDLDFDDDPGASLFKKLMPVGLGLIAVSVIGGGILIMLGDNKPVSNIPDAIPLIEAETTPEKTKPVSPGGMDIPNQDKLILNNGSGTSKLAQIEKLLPPPEIPLPPKAEEPNVTEATKDASQTLPSVAENETIATTSQIVEKKLSELKPPPLDAKSAAPEATASQSSGIESVLAPKPEVKIPSKVIVPEKVAKPLATAKTKVVSKAKLAPKPLGKLVSGQYILQLASLKSKEGAMTEWKSMRRKLPNLLGDKQPIIEKATISGVGIRYRLQTGPFVSKKSASDFCSKLKSAKRDCLVKKVK